MLGFEGKAGSSSVRGNRNAARRAKRPRPLQPTAAMDKARLERDAYLEQREGLERRSIFRGLIMLAILVLVFSLVRAGTERVFYAGWWRQW